MSVVIQLIPNQSNRRSTVQLYFPLWCSLLKQTRPFCRNSNEEDEKKVLKRDWKKLDETLYNLQDPPTLSCFDNVRSITSVDRWR